MPRQPAQITYNDLNGAEAREILSDWFSHLLSSQPLLQSHLTLPKARIGLAVNVSIDMYNGGTIPVASQPDTVDIAGYVSINNETSGSIVGSGGGSLAAPTASSPDAQHIENTLSTVINASPLPGGQPPDQIREQHGLPIPRPAYGPRETGSHIFLADVIERTGDQPDQSGSARCGVVAEGYKFAAEVPPVGPAASLSGGLEQTIPIDRGAIEIDRTGAGKMRQGDMIVTAGKHIASAKSQGDQRGAAYGSVSGTYDAGPAGLAQPGRSGGLYSDGRTKISFGNNHKG